MPDDALRQFARELLQYGEQMYLNWCAAMAVLEASGIPERKMLFSRAAELLQSKVRGQFQPLREKLEAVLSESETQDEVVKLLERLPKDRLN